MSDTDPQENVEKQAQKFVINCAINPLDGKPYPLVIDPLTGTLRVNSAVISGKINYNDSDADNFDDTDLSKLFDGNPETGLARAATGQDSYVDIYFKEPIKMSEIMIGIWNGKYSNMKMTIYDENWNNLVVHDDSSDNSLKYGESIKFDLQYVNGFKIEWLQNGTANDLRIDELIFGTVNLVDIATPLKGYDDDSDAYKFIQGARDGYQRYEDASFVTGESPRVLDVNTDLGRNATNGYIINDGAGDIDIEISHDGATYGQQFRLKSTDGKFDLTGINVDSIRLAWVADCGYRILVR